MMTSQGTGVSVLSMLDVLLLLKTSAEPEAYLDCLALQIGHSSQQAVAVAGLKVQIIRDPAKQVRCLFELVVALIEQSFTEATNTLNRYLFC